MLLDCGDPCMTLARRKSAKVSHISGGFSNEPPSGNLSFPKTTRNGSVSGFETPKSSP